MAEKIETMKGEEENEKPLVRYLMGGLPEEQQLQVEGKFLGDDQHYERLLALENELFYDYAQGKLSPGEREQFEKRFLASEQNRIRVRIALALTHKMSEAAPTVPVEREPQFLWKSLKLSFIGQGMAMRISVAALALVLLVSILPVIGIISLRKEFNQFRTQQAVQEDRLQRQARQESARADELNLKLNREMDENAKLKQGLSRMQAQSSSQIQRLASVISLDLAPSFVRDRATGMKRLYLPPGVRLLKLQLSLNGEFPYKSYQATLLTVEGVEKWRQDKLRALRTDSGQAIVLNLLRRLLDDGDYELRIKGTASDGALEDTGNYYYFSIVSK